jgi:Kef-type K+ transport system membrane component KefB
MTGNLGFPLPTLDRTARAFGLLQMHYLLKPLWQAMYNMNDRELKLSIILGLLLFVAGLLDLFGILKI